LANIDIISMPSGAQVFIDSTDTGKITPVSLDILPGDHTYLLRMGGYVDIMNPITILAGNYYILNAMMQNSLDVAAQKYYGDIIKLYTASLAVAVVALIPIIFRKEKKA
jgi:hypothetical protein